MSKYFNAGPSRYLKTKRVERPATVVATATGAVQSTRNSSGYTENDERLFEELGNATPFSINTRRVHVNHAANHTTAYTSQDNELFDKLGVGDPQQDKQGSGTREHRPSSSRVDETTHTTKPIRIMEFDDHSPTRNETNQIASDLSHRIRYFD